MEAEFWKKRWIEQNTPWHQSEPEPLLTKYFSKKGAKQILVPLCGKSLDVLWISNTSDKVIGVELSPIACQRFFEEQSVNYKTECQRDFKVFSSKNIELWCGDFFKLPAKVYLTVDFIYDRAAIIALPPALQEAYANKIIEISETSTANNFQILMIGRVDEGLQDGPPFQVGDSDIDKLFSQKMNVEILEKISRPSRGDPKLQLIETAYKLTLK